MEITINDLNELPLVAHKLLTEHADKRVFAFYGEMGAGKTTFIKAICQHLDVINETSSPTFAIINEYQTSGQDMVYHFDFYRLNKQEEAFDIGFQDYIHSGSYCLIEWPQIVEDHLLEDIVRVDILQSENENERIIRF